MKHYEHIRKGSQIETLDGLLTATYYNGSIVYFDAMQYNDETQEYDIPGTETRMTLNEVGNALKEMDGRNHYMTWDEEEEDN